MKIQSVKIYTEAPKEETKNQIPSLSRVFLHNDDFTPKEFVIGILEKFFFMDRINASAVTQEAHLKGMAICGAFSWDLAEAKVSQVVDYARENEFPLILSTEVAV